MALKLITAPTAPAVLLAEAKQHLRIDSSDDDALVNAMIAAATEAAEQITGRALMSQTWRLSESCFSSEMKLTRIPVASVSSIQYLDASGADLTLPAQDYTVCNMDDFEFARVVPAYGKSWPAARFADSSVRITFIAGYAAAAQVPESIKAWIKLQVGAMYENRAAASSVQTFALGFADRLLDRYKVWGV